MNRQARCSQSLSGSFSLSTLLIVIALIGATLVQWPMRERYVSYHAGLHEYRDIYGISNGSPMVAERTVNLPFFGPPALLVLLYVWKCALRRARAAEESGEM